jgi:hypothetical protein
MVEMNGLKRPNGARVGRKSTGAAVWGRGARGELLLITGLLCMNLLIIAWRWCIILVKCCITVEVGLFSPHAVLLAFA